MLVSLLPSAPLGEMSIHSGLKPGQAAELGRASTKKKEMRNLIG